MARPRVLTWHVHGNYLWYLSRADAEFVLPVDPTRGPGYGGRGTSFPFGPNVVEVPAAAVRTERFDLVLYQHRRHWAERDAVLSADQLRLPRVYLEHDTPQEKPAGQPHWFDDPGGLLVHCTPFNAVMWDAGRTPTKVIDHGVWVPDSVRYTGELARGVTAVNHLRARGRRLGLDVFLAAREHVPLDLIGMDAESLGGLGEVPPPDVPRTVARYRLFFHPVRWTSLGLAVLEAMAVGVPVVGLAATELPTVVRTGHTGVADTDPRKLVAAMRGLLADPAEARRLGANGRKLVAERFAVGRFARDWEQTFADVVGRRPVRAAGGAAGTHAGGQ